MPAVKKDIWGGKFWADGYYIATVGKHSSEVTICRYVKKQDKNAKYKRPPHEQQRCFSLDTPQVLLIKEIMLLFIY